MNAPSFYIVYSDANSESQEYIRFPSLVLYSGDEPKLIIYTSRVCRRWLKVHRKYIVMIEKSGTGMRDELEPITFTSVSIGTCLKDENTSVFHPTFILTIFDAHNHYYRSYYVNLDLYN